jgi:predicted N-acyltransferase
VTTTTVHRGLPPGWDTLAGAADLLVSAHWYAAQGTGFAELGGWTATVRDGSGTLLAGLPVFALNDDDPITPYSHPARVLAMSFGDHQPDTRCLMPSLLCGGRQSAVTRALTGARLPAAERELCVARLVSAAVRHAAELSLSSVAFLYVNEHDRPLRAALLDAGFTEKGSGETFQLNVGWPDFAGYLASLSRHRRQVIRQEVRRVARAGVRLETATLAEAPLDRLVDLTGQSMAKYGRDADKAATMAELERLRDTFGERALVFQALLGDEIAGYGLKLRWRDHLYARFIGFDYRLQGSLPLYFAAAYYAAIGYAAEHGIAAIHYGPTAGDAKMRRGCDRIPQYAYYLGLTEEVDAWLRAAIPTR